MADMEGCQLKTTDGKSPWKLTMSVVGSAIYVVGAVIQRISAKIGKFVLAALAHNTCMQYNKTREVFVSYAGLPNTTRRTALKSLGETRGPVQNGVTMNRPHITGANRKTRGAS